MDTLLKNGGFASAANGRPYRIGGADEIFQRAKIRLTVPLGSFCFDPALGSRLHTLTGKEPDPDAAALLDAQEALQPLAGVTAVSAEYSETPPTVKIAMEYCGQKKTAEVKL